MTCITIVCCSTASEPGLGDTANPNVSISLKETGPKPEEFSVQYQKLDVSFGISYQYTKSRYVKGSFTPLNQNLRMVEVGGDFWRSSGQTVLKGHLEQDGDSTKFLSNLL